MTQAVAGSRVSRAERESRSKVEELWGREPRVGGELNGTDEESRSGCRVRLEVRFWCTTQQKVRLKLAFLAPQKRQKKCVFLKTLPCRMAVRGTKHRRQRGKSDGVPDGLPDYDDELHNTNPPTPCLWLCWQAPASAQKTKRKTRPAIRRSARWRVSPRWPAVRWCSVSRSNRRGDGRGGSRCFYSARVIPLE